MRAVCVDASLALAWVIPAEAGPRSRGLLETWLNEPVALLGPPLLYAEVVSVVRNKVHRRFLLPEEGDAALETFFSFGIARREPAGLYQLAYRLATQFARHQAYDAQYVALAQIEQCDLWTIDRALRTAYGRSLPWVRLLE